MKQVVDVVATREVAILNSCNKLFAQMRGVLYTAIENQFATAQKRFTMNKTDLKSEVLQNKIGSLKNAVRRYLLSDVSTTHHIPPPC